MDEQFQQIIESLYEIVALDDNEFAALKDSIINTLREELSMKNNRPLLTEIANDFRERGCSSPELDIEIKKMTDSFYYAIEPLKKNATTQDKLEFVDVVYSIICALFENVKVIFNEDRCDVKVQKLNEFATLPVYAHESDAGADVTACEAVEIKPHETGHAVHTGLAFNLPTGWFLTVRPRSGMSKKTPIRVSNAPGTIDTDYRGEVMVLVDNIGDEPYIINVGDRIAQLVLEKKQTAVFTEVADVNEDGNTERASGGFGSTGM